MGSCNDHCSNPHLIKEMSKKKYGHCRHCRSNAPPPPPPPPTGDLGTQTDVELGSFSTPRSNPSETSSSTLNPRTSTPSEDTLMMSCSEKATSVTDLTTTSTESTKPLVHNAPVSANTRSKTKARRLF